MGCKLRNLAMHLLILWFRVYYPDGAINVNFCFDCKTILCLIVTGGPENIYFCTRKFQSTRYTQPYK